jgi:type IV pilus assembly protein PilC
MMRLKKIPAEEMIEFWAYLGHLTGSALPLIQALDIIASLVKTPSFKKIIYDMIHQLTQGESFSDAIRSHPRIFSPSVFQLVGLAEQIGHYSFIFCRLEEQERWRYQAKNLIKNALRYPLILCGILVLFIILLIGWLIPNLKGYLFLIGKKELPLVTKILIFVGDHAFLALLCLFGMVFVGLVWSIVRRRFDLKPFRYSLPGIGILLYRLQIINFGHNLGILLKARVDILSALYHSAESLSCPWLKKSLLRQEALLVSGHPLSQALIPILGYNMGLTRILVIGETSGDLADLLVRFTEFDLRQTQQTLKSLLEFLQPLMLIIMGGLLAWTIAAVLFPLYDILGTIND